MRDKILEKAEDRSRSETGGTSAVMHSVCVRGGGGTQSVRLYAENAERYRVKDVQ